MKHVHGDSWGFRVWARCLCSGLDGGGFFVFHCGVVFRRRVRFRDYICVSGYSVWRLVRCQKKLVWVLIIRCGFQISAKVGLQGRYSGYQCIWVYVGEGG